MKMLLRYLLWVFLIPVIQAQNFTAPLTSSSEVGFQLAGYTELESERDAYQRAYITDDGQTVYQFSKSPLNYKDDQGSWKPVNIDPKERSAGWVADEQPFSVRLSRTGSVIVDAGNGEVFRLENHSVFGVTTNTDHTIHEGGKFILELSEHVKQQSVFRINGMKVDYLVEEIPVGAPTIIEQQLICPEGYTITPHNDLQNALSIRNNSGDEVGVLYPIVCYDASGEYSVGKYTFQKNKDGFRIRLELDEAWMKSSERTYPVTVDPLITGPTSVWVGGVMPSCDLPNYNADSIQVTIPGGITITGVFVTSSYYADPFSGSTMSNGEMYFSSSCGNTPTLTVGPPNGNAPGTAFLDSVDYRSPLTCCLGADCQDRNFWVRMHLGRNNGGVGCNATFIYYDPATLWPFSVFVQGRTVETGGFQWNVTPSVLCSDECDVTIRAYGRYGVPPYTLFHSWTSDSTVFGNPIMNCALLSQDGTLDVTRPNCPTYCDTITNIPVPVPTIRDACGNVFSGFNLENLTLNPTPQITVTPDTMTLCSGENAQITFQACPPGTTVNWNTPGFNGTDMVDTTLFYTGNDTLTTIYTATANLNGCEADTQMAIVWVTPNPVADFSFPDIAFINQDVIFLDSSQYFSGQSDTWNWDFGNGSMGSDSMNTISYPDPGTYQVCMIINNTGGCADTICDSIQIIPMQITLPNVVSPNGDGINDILYFQYLEFFGQIYLSVYNRWGMEVYVSDNYQNDWVPDNVTDGTYFYVIRLGDGTEYTSTLNVFNDP